MDSIRKISPAPQNSVLTIAAEYALNSNRYYLILENDGIFRLYKKKCHEGIGGREIEPEVGTLNDLWDHSLYVNPDPYHGINPRRDDVILPNGWPRNYWPSEREVFLAINAHELHMQKYPSLDIYLPV